MIACDNGSDDQLRRKNVFKYNIPSALNSLDPAFAKDQAGIWVSSHLFNTLVEVNQRMEIIPSIAKHWTISNDALTYTFTIRNDVHFHDSPCFDNHDDRRLTASDIAYSFERIISPKTASPGAWIFNEIVADKNPFIAANDTTFILNLKKPFVPILGILMMPYCSIISAKAHSYYGEDWRTHPIGSGPFQLNKWRENDVLILSANKQYWEKDSLSNPLPYLDGIRISFDENKKNAYLAFIKGNADILNGIDGTYKDQVLEPNGSINHDIEPIAYLMKSPFLNTEYLGFNLADTLGRTKNKYLRQAMNYAIDRAKMIKFMRNNRGTPAHAGFIPIGLPGYDSTIVRGYHYNPEKAKELLKKAGFNDHNPIPKLSLETTATYQDLCVFLQKQWNEIGIPVKVELNPSAHLREKIRKGEASFFRASWIADYPEAQSYLDVFKGSNSAPPNYTRFKSKEYDVLYEQAIQETNDSLRYIYYQKMDKIIIEEAPVIPLYYDEALRFVSHTISGMELNAMNLMDLKKVKKSN